MIFMASKSLYMEVLLFFLLNKSIMEHSTFDINVVLIEFGWIIFNKVA